MSFIGISIGEVEGGEGQYLFEPDPVTWAALDGGFGSCLKGLMVSPFFFEYLEASLGRFCFDIGFL